MPQSLSKMLVHIIFSTKDRRRMIPEPLYDQLRAYLGSILNDIDCPPVTIGAVADHVHVLCCLSKRLSVAALVEKIKVGSSKWLKTKDPALATFGWQNGYGAFSVSQSNVPAVRRYIAGQNEHHRTMSFQDEFREFLRRHHIEFEERYVWG